MSAGVVRVQPAELELELGEGETLIEAAWRRGYTWPTECYGKAECTRCFVRVVDGAENLSPVSGEEERALAALPVRRHPDRPLRLACRLQVSGTAVVKKSGVKPAAD